MFGERKLTFKMKYLQLAYSQGSITQLVNH